MSSNGWIVCDETIVRITISVAPPSNFGKITPNTTNSWSVSVFYPLCCQFFLVCLCCSIHFHLVLSTWFRKTSKALKLSHKKNPMALKSISLILISSLITLAFASDVIELNEDNFDQQTQIATGASAGDWFIEFFAPWYVRIQYNTYIPTIRT